jgi:hypothetical protein
MAGPEPSVMKRLPKERAARGFHGGAGCCFELLGAVCLKLGEIGLQLGGPCFEGTQAHRMYVHPLCLSCGHASLKDRPQLVHMAVPRLGHACGHGAQPAQGSSSHEDGGIAVAPILDVLFIFESVPVLLILLACINSTNGTQETL